MRGFYLVYLIIFANGVFGQNLKDLVKGKVSYVSVYDTSALTPNQMYIAMPYAKDVVLNPKQLKKLNETVVVKLELIYTKHRTSLSFNQEKLNVNRLITLKKFIPTIFNNPIWDFELISQTKATNAEAGKTLFHGFVITFRPNSNKTSIEKEVSFLKQLTADSTQANNSDSIKKDFEIKSRWDDRIGFVHDTVWVLNKDVNPPDIFFLNDKFKDSTVFEAFSRISNFANSIIVTDVTGSMSPYISQVLVWLKQQTENNEVTHFVFFNDGDNKKSNQKKAGKTGGVYWIENSSINQVINKAAYAMQKGSGGGEGLENDVEALLLAKSLNKNVSQLILVADNFESMRDYSFIEKIKIPVSVVVCGGSNRINIQYLDLAKKTEGKVYSKHTDVKDLKSVKNNDKIIINNRQYLYKNNRFHYIY